MGDVRVRMAQPEDAGQLVDIYAFYVRKTAVCYDTVVPSVDECAECMARILRHYPYLVAQDGATGTLLGYAHTGRLNWRAGYDWSAETTIYLRPDTRGRGVGRRLYDTLEGVSQAQGILSLNACVACTQREDEYLTNASPRFHERMGFRRVGVFHQCACKFGRWYDMVWMEKMIGEHRADPAAVRPAAALAPSELAAAGLWMGEGA